MFKKYLTECMKTVTVEENEKILSVLNINTPMSLTLNGI